MTKIITDSACDLTDIRMVYDRNQEPVQFARAPLTIRVGERDFVDNDDLDVAEMMAAMKAHDGKTSSACPGPGDWCEAFAGADEIFVVTITSGLSGSYNSAVAAREIELEQHPEKRIHVIDSLSTGPEMELIVYHILHEIQEGREFEEICRSVAAYQKSTKLIFVLHSMDNLVKNGRVSRVVGFAANLLGISVIGRASRKGELEMIGKNRGNSKSNESVLREMKLQGYDGGYVSITHCMNESAAAQLEERIRREYPFAAVTVSPMGGLCSYYAEQGGLIIGYETTVKGFSLSSVLAGRERGAECPEA